MEDLEEQYKQLPVPVLQLIFESVTAAYDEGKTKESLDGIYLEDVYQRVLVPVKRILDDIAANEFITQEGINWISD